MEGKDQEPRASGDSPHHRPARDPKLADHHGSEDQLTPWRGDFTTLAVPLASLRKRAAKRLDPRRLRITDYGRTLAFGDYEASVDSSLYDRDPACRRRANRQAARSRHDLGRVSQEAEDPARCRT